MTSDQRLAAALSPPAPDVIELVGLTAFGHHGVLEHERIDGQEFGADLRLHVDNAAAARSDALERTVNYAAVADAVVEEIQAGPYRLIETLADRIAHRVLRDQVLVRRLDVTVHKPSAPIPHHFTDVRLHLVRDGAPVPVALALGSNLGPREQHLERALDLLHAAEGVEITWTAPVVETDPVGGIAQDAFLNTVVGLTSRRGPWGLLDLTQAIEADARRVRELRWGPRTLDVDVVLYGDLQQDDPDLTLPHPRAHERAFVLAPWHAARPDAVLLGHGPIADLLADTPDRAGVRPGPPVDGFGEPAGGTPQP